MLRAKMFWSLVLTAMFLWPCLLSAVELKAPRDVTPSDDESGMNVEVKSRRRYHRPPSWVFRHLARRIREASRESTEPTTSSTQPSEPTTNSTQPSEPPTAAPSDLGGSNPTSPARIEKQGIPVERLKVLEAEIEQALASSDSAAARDALADFILELEHHIRMFLSTPEQREAYLLYLEATYPQIAKVLQNGRVADRRAFVQSGLSQATYAFAEGNALMTRIDAAVAAGNNEEVGKLFGRVWNRIKRRLQTPEDRKAWLDTVKANYPNIAKLLADNPESVEKFIAEGIAETEAAAN